MKDKYEELLKKKHALERKERELTKKLEAIRKAKNKIKR